MKKKLLKSLKQTITGLWTNIPIILGILILIAVLKHYVSMDFLSKIDNKFLATILAGIFGGISAGNPINSYIIAGEFGNITQNILIISAFLISWVTVGSVQIPAESYFFGKKFAILRNLLALLFSFLGAYAVFLLYNLF